jgi:hypothetical protein
MRSFYFILGTPEENETAIASIRLYESPNGTTNWTFINEVDVIDLATEGDGRKRWDNEQADPTKYAKLVATNSLGVERPTDDVIHPAGVQEPTESPNRNRVLYITQRSPFVHDITVRDANGVPTDLTGYTAEMFIAKYYGSSYRYQVPCLVQDALSGLLRISINDEGTAQLPEGMMLYSIYLIPPTPADKYVLMTNQVVVMASI